MFFTLTASARNRAAFFILFILFGAPALQAQIMQKARVELPMNEPGIEKFKAISVGEEGLILYRRIYALGDDQIELIKMDTALHENWKGFMTINKNLTLLQAYRGRESIFMLLRDRASTGNFVILMARISSGMYLAYEIKNLIPFTATEFVVTDQAAFIGGNYNYRPLVLYFNFGSKRSKILPGFFNETGELNQLKSYDDGSVDIIVNARNLERRKALWIRSYDPSGDLVKTIVINPGEKKNLIFGRSIKLANGEEVVAGVYGRFPDYSRGIFLTVINPAGEYIIDYYNFANLKNFFSYMKAKRQKRVKERIERKTIRGKKIKFNYRFLIHDLIPYKNQFIMTGEAFYPHYVFPNQGTYPMTMRTMPGYYGGMQGGNTSTMVFDGYQYTHAVIIGFNVNGKLLWDNSFEINEKKTMQLEQFVRVKPEKDRIVMMYLFDNALRAKIIRGSEVLEGKHKDPLKTNQGSEGLVVKNIESEYLDYWYADNFFAYGVQRLQGNTGGSQRIFFINKIAYQVDTN